MGGNTNALKLQWFHLPCPPSLTPAGLHSVDDRNRPRNTTNTKATTDGVKNVVAALLFSPWVVTILQTNLDVKIYRTLEHLKNKRDNI